MRKSIKLRGSQRRAWHYYKSGGPQYTLELDSLSGGSGGVEFKVGLDGCKASEVLGIHLRVWYP